MVLVCAMFAGAALQWAGYLGYKTRWPKVGYLVNLLLFAFYCYLLPTYLEPVGSGATEAYKCGMPQLAIFILCWLFGTVNILINHLVYQLVRKYKSWI